MIKEVSGCINYDECGAGPAIVPVPGSCSTGAARCPIIWDLSSRFRCLPTSLQGYVGTVERRTASDPCISHEAEVLESVVRKADGPVHLVGHSFGGLVALVVALRNQVLLSSLAILEAPAMELLHAEGEDRLYRLFRDMTKAYFADFAAGNASAIAAMTDFYGGAGTLASWPSRGRAYAERTAPVNIVDWASAFGFPLSAAILSAIRVPVIVARGGASHPAMQRANALLCKRIDQAALVTIDGAAHFMVATTPRKSLI
ncbi:pimeloyl-ACP methyl ester carboxylesterase [Bradyrhizobium sp. i1.3.1]